jgi:nucleotide-binding universal stress UspA family protein
MFKNILLAVDGSEHALKAARLAGEMARLTKANLWVITSFEPIPAYLGEPNLSQVIAARTLEADSTLKNALEQVGDISGELKSEVLEGPAAEAILNVASVREIDLIVMGTRGLGRLAGALLGSQSQKVMSHATCPVLLAR